MKKHIVCQGDSNTHGYCADPAGCADSGLARFNENERWTCLLQKALGEEYLVIEEGLCGRTTVFDDPVEEGLAALPYLYPCLKSHEPVSLLIVMLGTNDTKERLGANAYAIGLGMRRLLKKAQSIGCWGPGGVPNILLWRTRWVPAPWRSPGRFPPGSGRWRRRPAFISWTRVPWAARSTMWTACT